MTTWTVTTTANGQQASTTARTFRDLQDLILVATAAALTYGTPAWTLRVQADQGGAS
jgi:hypothetical protein